MTLNASGPLSFGGATTGQSINLELGVSATALASINSTSFRTLAGVSSGQISVSNFYGKSNTVGYYSLVNTTSVNLNPGDNCSGIDSSNNFWMISSAGGSQPSWQWVLDKWNSSNVFQSSTRFQTTGSSPFTQGVSAQAQGSNAVGYDNNLYFTGTQGGLYSSVNVLGYSVIKWSSSGAGSWTAGKSTYVYASSYGGNQMYATYLYGKAVCADSSSTVYCFPLIFWIWISGYDCCGNPMYSSDTYRMVGALGSSLSPSTFRKPVDATGQSGQPSNYYGATNAAGLNYAGTAVQVPSAGGFVTQISQRTGDAGNWNWSYTYRVTYAGSSQIIYNDAGKSTYVDSQNAYIAIDFQNYRLMKVNSSGTFQWANEYVFPSYTYGLASQSACVDSSDNIYLIGICQSYYTNPYLFAVLKINSSGVLQWSRLLSSLTTPSVTGDERNLRASTITARGTDLVIGFSMPNSSNASYGLNCIVTYPQSGSFTGSTNVNFPGSSDYYTFEWSTLSTTVRAGTLVSATSQTTSLPSQSNPVGTISSLNVNNTSVTTSTVATTLVSY